MLSIIIPTYNSEKTIKDCLDSVLDLYKYNLSFEIILIDDGSSDKTRLIDNEYSSKYENVKFFKQNHGGVSVARNHGLKYSKGSWICFLDSDDTLNASQLFKSLKKYAKPQNDIIITNISRNGNNVGVKSCHISKIKKFLNYNYPIYKNLTIMDMAGKIYRSNIINSNNIDFCKGITIGEDFIFTLNFLMCAKGNIVQTPICYYNYYINVRSTVANYNNKQIKSRVALFNTLKNLYSHFNLSIKALNWIKIEMAYSILLNDLKLSNNKIQKLHCDKRNIYNLNLISKKYGYKSIECLILRFIIAQPSIYVLYLCLKFINIIRYIIILHKI